jgi:hypothetical protein
MKLYDDMTQAEQKDFLKLMHGILTEIRAETAVEQASRPALIVLWAMGHKRATMNLWTQYDIDPSGFIDEAIRKGVGLMENLLHVMHRHPPPTSMIDPAELQRMSEDGRQIIHIMRAPAYRPTVTFTFEDFFRQARERGEL